MMLFCCFCFLFGIVKSSVPKQRPKEQPAPFSKFLLFVCFIDQIKNHCGFIKAVNDCKCKVLNNYFDILCN